MKRKPLAKWLAWSIMSSLLALGACYSELKPIPEIGSFKVEFEKGTAFGTVKKPLKVRTSPVKYKMTVTALKPDGQLDTAFNGTVCLYTNRGTLVGSHKPLTLSKGKITDAPISLKLAFGKTTLWASEGSKPGSKTDKCPNSADPTDITAPYIGRVGVAPSLHFTNLSIQDLQASNISPYDSPLYKKYALIDQGKMVVMAVTNNGFYVTDINTLKAGGGYHSLFVFTFSAPSLTYSADSDIPKTLGVGDIVTQIEGGVDEFSGHTQITFPNFKPDWKDENKGIVNKIPQSELPKAIPLSLPDTWSRRKMEPLESALVIIKDAIAIPFDQQQDGWKQFRQWPVLLVQAKKKADQAKCEDLVKTELYLHTDPKKNTGSKYRSCLAGCHKIFKDEQSVCKKDDEECLSKATDAWFSCFFSTCRFDREHGLFARFDKAGCNHALLLVISNSTVPGYDPTTPEHFKQRFSYIRGILIQTRASGFYKLSKSQYENEQSNNGYVIWVRDPDDLGLPK